MKEEGIYFVKINNEEFGPFSVVDLRRHIDSQNILPTDLARADGADEWLPVSSLLQESTEPKHRRISRKGIHVDITSPIATTEAPNTQSASGVNAILAPGCPPLTQDIVDMQCAYFSFMLGGIELPADVRVAFREDLIAEWQNDMQQTEQASDFRKYNEWIASGTVSEKKVKQEFALKAFVMSMGQSTHQRGLVLLREMYAQMDPVLFPGTPPVTRRMTDAHAILINLARAIVGGYPAEPVSNATLDVFARVIERRFPAMDQEVREVFVERPWVLAQLADAWGKASSDEKQQIRNDLAADTSDWEMLEGAEKDADQGAPDSTQQDQGIGKEQFIQLQRFMNDLEHQTRMAMISNIRA